MNVYYTPTEIFINYIFANETSNQKKSFSFFKKKKQIQRSKFDTIVDDTIKKIIARDGTKTYKYNYLNYICELGSKLTAYCQSQIESLDLRTSLIDFYLYKALIAINYPVALTYYFNEKVDLTNNKCFKELTKYEFDLQQIDNELEEEQPYVNDYVLNWETHLYLECEDRPRFQLMSIEEYIKELALDLDRRFDKFLDNFELNENEKQFYFDLIQYELDLINLKLIAEIDLNLTEPKYHNENMTTVNTLLLQAKNELESTYNKPVRSNLIIKK